MERIVKEMHKLLDQEVPGDSFRERAEMYFEKRPELIAYVEDLNRMCRALAEEGDNHATAVLRKYLEPDQNSRGSVSGSEPPFPWLSSSDCTPDSGGSSDRST